MNRYLWEKRLRGCMAVLTPTEYVVLTMAALYADRSGDGVRPSQTELSDDTGFGVRTVSRALGALVKKGYLEQTREGKGRHLTNAYRLVWDMPHVAEFESRKDATATTENPSHGTGFETEKTRTATTENPSHGTGFETEKTRTATTENPYGGTDDQVRTGKDKDTRTPVDDVRNCSARETESSTTSTEWSDGTPIGEPPADTDTDRPRHHPADPATVTTDATRPTPAESTASARTVVRQELGTAGYPRRTIDRLAVQVDRLARQGIPDDVTREALREWDRRPGAPRPEWLETIASDVVAARRARAAPDQPVRPSKLRVIAELAAAERAKEHQSRKELLR